MTKVTYKAAYNAHVHGALVLYYDFVDSS